MLTTEVCADTRSFRHAMPCRSGSFDYKEGAWLRVITDLLSEPEVRNIAGLTRDSDYILINQLALEQGFYPVYRGGHHYRDGMLEHYLKAERSGIRTFRDALAAAGGNWSAALAGQLPSVTALKAPQCSESFSMAVKRPADSPGYLVSWYFHRIGV